MSYLQSRTFIGASLFLAFIVLLITSFLLFSQQHSDVVALLHTLLGFLMVIVVVWHLAKNKTPLFNYLNPFKKHQGKFNLSLPLSLIIVVYLVLSPFLRLSPAMEVYELGQTLKAADRGVEQSELNYVVRNTSSEHSQGQEITIELTKGPYFLWPQYAIWLETLSGEFVQPLYVTSAIATNNFTNKVEKRDPNQVFNSHLMIGDNPLAATALKGENDPASKDSRMRPESLPVFLHKLGLQAQNGYFVPTQNNPTIDGFSGATMTNNFIYTTKLLNRLSGKYKVRFEINHSFDFNGYYSSDRFPDDAVYSGNGYSAQPSVIYETVIDFAEPLKLNLMALVGRGHHSGKNGDLYHDTENLTTALELVERILVSTK